MTATDSDLDLLDYTAQAQQLVADLQRLKSAATVFDEASERLVAGRAAIDEAGATLADRSDMALLIYEDALQFSKHALAEAVGRMDTATALATQSAGILADLQQLQEAAQALTGAQTTIDRAALQLADHAGALQAGATAYRDVINDGTAARDALEMGRQDLAAATAGLDAVAGRVDAATAAVIRQVDLSGQGTEHLLRTAAGLGGALGDLTGARDSLEETQSLLVVAANQLSAAHDHAAANTTALEAAAKQFAATQAPLVAMRGTLETAHATLAEAANTSADQVRAFTAATHELGTQRESLATGLAETARRQQAADATLRALTTASQARAQQMNDGFDRLDARLVGLHPIVTQLARSAEQISPQLDRNAKGLEATVAAALRAQATQFAAEQRAQTEQLAAIRATMRVMLGVAGATGLGVLALLAYILLTRGT
ncbi:MAG: hypothetical protein QM692_03335 [Thermomicrobiales bacterium]